MIKLKINGNEIEVKEGITVLEACQEQGIHIPHFCYHPALETVGSCRLCQVEFKAPGRPRLDITCRTTVAEGMEIETHTEAAVKARAGVLEFLLANHPLDCPICDKAGECPLQDYSYEHGFSESRYEEARRRDVKRTPLGGHIIFDAERCVLCTRCVRFMADYAKAPDLTVTGRGSTSRIDIFPGKPMESNYTGNLADICPVGALTLEEFRFKVRSWNLSAISSVCPYCSRGCNIHLDVRTDRNKLYRSRPRENLEVNGHFICNEGRFRPLEAVRAEGRLTHCLLHGTEASCEQALQQAASALKEHKGKILVVGSPRRTTEELYLIRETFGSLEGARCIAAEPDREAPDGILRTGENAPNMKALDLLGFELLSLDALGEAINDPEIDALILLDAAIDLRQDTRDSFKFILFMDYVTTGVTEFADVTLPGRAWFEKDGTFINHEGRVQRILPALKPAKTGHGDDLRILSDLYLRIHGKELPARAEEVFKTLAEELAPMKGLNYSLLGDLGALLKKEEGGQDHE